MMSPTSEQARAETEVTRLLKLADRREQTVAQVALWVALGVVEGRLEPGADLNSVDLATRFGSSRTPVREALMLLESEGLVEIRARKRPRVASFTSEQVREIYFLRGYLLALMGRLAAAQVTDDEVADLRARLATMRGFAAGGDVDGYFWAHVDLQKQLTVIAGNRTLASVLDSMALRTLVLRRVALARPGRLLESYADQERILDAIADRDTELAAMLLSRATDRALAAIDHSQLGGPALAEAEGPVATGA